MISMTSAFGREERRIDSNNSVASSIRTATGNSGTVQRKYL